MTTFARESSPLPELVSLPMEAENPWTKCRRCDRLIYVPRLRRDLGVCPECGHHGRLSTEQRLDMLLDPGSFVSADGMRVDDALGFTDRLPYQERLRRARNRTGLDDALVYGRGHIAEHPVVIVVLDFAFMGGSMGAAVGEGVTRAAEHALATRTPLLVVTASGGARMQEGAISLMQMAKTAEAFAALRAAGVPSICVLTDPTYGGVTASFATLGDVLIAEARAAIGFAGPNVIEKATGTALPAGFQRAEHLLRHGMVDRVEQRSQLRPLLARLLALFEGWRDGGQAEDPAITDPEAIAELPAHQVLGIARDLQRPTTLDYAARMCDDFVELHGDRLYGDDPAVVGGLAMLRGNPVMLIGHQKGHETKELIARNFGMPEPEGYRKALRLMRLADRLGIPVVTLVDTQGAFPGIGSEERGQAWAIAESVAGMSELTVPVVTVVTGEGGSGGALALAVANRVLINQYAYYSVISPESCSTILYGDQSHTGEVAESLGLTSAALMRLGIVDGVLPEPQGGAQQSPRQAAATLADAVYAALSELRELPAERLKSMRRQRFRRFGTPRVHALEEVYEHSS